MSMTDDPWSTIERPGAPELLTAKRVHANGRWDFFWARGIDGKCLLLLQHGVASDELKALPRLKGVELSHSQFHSGQRPLLVIKLVESQHRDIFLRLCHDIVACTDRASSEREAVELAVSRTWRWHHLLRGGSDGRLTREEQKGLIGELLVIERLLLPLFTARVVVEGWRGPLNAPKDFEFGKVCIEAKARRGAATPYVTINSEHQLDTAEVDLLYLDVVDLTAATSSSEDAFTVIDVALRVRQAIHDIDPSAISAFDTLIQAAGLDWTDDYADAPWLLGEDVVYKVSAGFPRITAYAIPAGVRHVRYSVSLVECKPFEVAKSEVITALKEGVCAS